MTQAVYHYIVAYYLEHQLPPTIREIRDGCHLSSTSVAHSCVQNLVADGLLTMWHGRVQVVAAQWKAPPICPLCFKSHGDWREYEY